MARFGIGRRFLTRPHGLDEVRNVRDRFLGAAGGIGRSVLQQLLVPLPSPFRGPANFVRPVVRAVTGE